MRRTLLLTIVLASAGACAQEPRLERDGISFLALPGASIEDHAFEGGRHTYLRIGEEVMARVVRGGSYAELPSDPRATRSATTMCGQPAVRMEIHTPRAESIGSYIGAEGHVQHAPSTITPERVDVMVGFTRADGTRLRFDWSVRADRRAHHEPSERAFYDSIRCRE